MTRALALNTSSWSCDLALVQHSASEGCTVVASSQHQVKDSHSIHLLRLVEALLDEAAWPKSSIDRFVAIRGPGSFTGIRIGLGTVLGLGLATNRPCVGISSLLAMTEAFGPSDVQRCPLIGAGRGEVYGALYDAADSPPSARIEPWVGPVEQALEGESVAAVYFGATEGLAEHPSRPRIEPAPAGIAAAAAKLALADPTPQQTDMTPLYIRPPDALLKKG